MAYYNPYNHRYYHCSFWRQMYSSRFSGLNESLEQQGIVGEATISCTYISTNVHAAWCFLQGMNVADEEFALDSGLRMATCVKILR